MNRPDVDRLRRQHEHWIEVYLGTRLGCSKGQHEDSQSIVQLIAYIEHLESQLAIAREALEFVSCEGMDDGDFYSEENIVDGTIAMANRAREALKRAGREQSNLDDNGWRLDGN